jgi:hypothetical protein
MSWICKEKNIWNPIANENKVDKKNPKFLFIKQISTAIKFHNFFLIEQKLYTILIILIIVIIQKIILKTIYI